MNVLRKIFLPWLKDNNIVKNVENALYFIIIFSVCLEILIEIKPTIFQ